MSVLGITKPDPTSARKGTGFLRFTSPSGIDGLGKPNGLVLDLLALFASKPRTGQLRNFLAQAKTEFNTIKIWHVWSDGLAAALARYSFREVTEWVIFVDGTTKEIEGWRWDK